MSQVWVRRELKLARYKTRSIFKKYINTDTFLGLYMKKMSSGETPAIYDFWSAMWILGTVLGREIVVPRPHAPVYMNWYIIIVANSGITRKSTAVNAAKSMLNLYRERFNPPICLLDGKSSPEAFEREMSEVSDAFGSAWMALNSSELTRFLGKEQYMMKMPALLVDMYDMPISMQFTTVARGKAFAIKPYITFFSASTPRWLNMTVNPTVIEGGFTSRTIFVKAEKRKKKIPWPEEGNNNDDDILDALHKVVTLAQQVKSIKMTDGAMKKFSLWYQEKEESVAQYSSSFESREDSHVLRLAACLAINNGEYQIDNVSIMQAIRIIRTAKDTGSYLFEGGTRPEDTQIGINKLVQTLITAGSIGVKTCDIYRTVKQYMDGKSMHYILNIMLELKMVTRRREFSGMKGRGLKPVIWTMTPMLTNFGKRARLIDKIEGLID